jgi:hypothetical protein
MLIGVANAVRSIVDGAPDIRARLLKGIQWRQPSSRCGDTNSPQGFCRIVGALGPTDRSI